MSGVKGRSGRKSNAQLHQLRAVVCDAVVCDAVVDKEMTEQDWRNVVRALVDIIVDGDRPRPSAHAAVHAAEILFSPASPLGGASAGARFGIPTRANDDQAPEPEETKWIEARGDGLRLNPTAAPHDSQGRPFPTDRP
jgi:hypothetical protein